METQIANTNSPIASPAVPSGRAQIQAEHSAEWVKRYNESGLSLRAFSAQNAISYMSLWRWVNRAKKQSAVAPAAVPTFAEIKLSPSLERMDWVAELSLPDGRLLRLAKNVPASLLEQLLRLC